MLIVVSGWSPYQNSILNFSLRFCNQSQWQHYQIVIQVDAEAEVAAREVCIYLLCKNGQV